MKHTDSGWISAGLTGFYTVCLLLVALWRNDGNFVYALDDPYIHLDIARQLALTGVYGLNPGEYAAPSSSILWPFLLVPMAVTPAFLYAPFLIGMAAAMASAMTIAHMLPRRVGLVPKIAFTLLAVLALNLPGLALVGMEHGVHILLSLLAALACCRLVHGHKPPQWLWLIIILHPLIRYEGVLVSAACLLLVFWKGYRREALITGALMCLPVIGFALFLHMHGLGYFPGSTIVKKLRLDAADGNFAEFWVRSLVVGLRSPSGIFLILAGLMMPILCVLRWRHWRSALYAALLSITLVLLGHLVLGRLSTWETPRYDQYAIAFIVPVALYLLHGQLHGRLRKGITAGFLLLLALPGMWSSLWGIQPAITSIYQQQYQMQRFARQYWHQSVAVNDIGLVGLGTDEYVLDLVGLANTEVRLARTHGQAGWAEAMVKQHNIKLIMIYKSWIKPEDRRDWIQLGELFRTSRTSLGDDSVIILTTDKAHVNDMKALLRDWAQDLPDGARYEETRN